MKKCWVVCISFSKRWGSYQEWADMENIFWEFGRSKKISIYQVSDNFFSKTFLNIVFLPFRSTSRSLSEFHNFKETVLISNMTEVNQALLQPICKLNSVTMETLKQEDGSFEVVISGSEMNVKRAKLQLEHCIS